MKLSKLKNLIKEEIQKLTEQESIPCGDSFIFSANGCTNPSQFTCSGLFNCFEFTGDNCINDPDNPAWPDDLDEGYLPAQFFTLEECCQSPSTEYHFNNLPEENQEIAAATCPNGIGSTETITYYGCSICPEGTIWVNGYGDEIDVSGDAVCGGDTGTFIEYEIPADIFADPTDPPNTLNPSNNFNNFEESFYDENFVGNFWDDYAMLTDMFNIPFGGIYQVQLNPNSTSNWGLGNQCNSGSADIPDEEEGCPLEPGLSGGFAEWTSMQFGISISEFCTKCDGDGSGINSWDPLGQEITQYCECCPPGQPGQPGPDFTSGPSTDTSNIMPLKNKSMKKKDITYRLKELAGIKEIEIDNKLMGKPKKQSPQIGCTNPAALNYDSSANVPCRAGDADWYVNEDGENMFYNGEATSMDPSSWFVHPVTGASISPMNYSNECCLFDCSTYEEWPGVNTAAWGPACDELWTQMYCEFGPAIALSTGTSYDWNGVQLANSYASMCEACASGDEGCPEFEEIIPEPDECVDFTSFDYTPYGFPTIEDFCGRCNVAHEQTQALAVSAGIPGCGCCESQVDITDYLDNICTEGFCYNPNNTGPSDTCLPC
jgi:hypothetical protein